MKTALLGIDEGTSACKVAAFDLEGHVLAQAAESYPVLYPQPGWAEQDPQQWWEAVCRALRRLWESGAVAPGEVAGVGIDGPKLERHPLDKEGRALCNTPIWMDTRAGSSAKSWRPVWAARRFSPAAATPCPPRTLCPRCCGTGAPAPGL